MNELLEGHIPETTPVSIALIGDLLDGVRKKNIVLGNLIAAYELKAISNGLNHFESILLMQAFTAMEWGNAGLSLVPAPPIPE